MTSFGPIRHCKNFPKDLALDGSELHSGIPTYDFLHQYTLHQYKSFWLQGGNLAETAEDVSLVSQTTEQAASDSNASVPGVETLMEDADEFESASQIKGPYQPVWDVDVTYARNGGSPSQKLLKDSLAAKELQTMEKHLADIEKDLALWEEASTSPHSNLLTSHHPGNLQATLGQNSRPQVPSQTGKNIHLQLEGNKSPPVSTTSRVQVSSISNSRPQTPNMQNNRPPTPLTPGSRPATPSLLPRPLTSSNQGNKEGILSMQRSRSLTSKSQIGRTLGTPSGLAVQMSGDVIGTVPQRISLSEVRFLIYLFFTNFKTIKTIKLGCEGLLFVF
ncbi:Putative protein C8orf34 like protein [Chelonia mydas]|uniref:Uncharacterized protein n=1 Tax=Chelonia mydas TaxID=8469 RepID=M7BVI4_CHEMY|nr:Putative protein C8orf34 like protein [Chelonia mydas]